MAAVAPTAVSSDATTTPSSDGPVLGLVNKRIRALRKKYNRILQMEESVSQGKTLNKEQEEVLRSKPTVSALIDELEKLRHPLSSAVSEEISLALQRQTISPEETTSQTEKQQPPDEPEHAVEDLLNLLYLGSLFDVKSQNDFTSTMLTRTHERGCCLTYDYVTDTDDATDLLSEKDLDLISTLSGLLTSRPADSSLSHKNALHRCIQHAKLWLSNSEQSIDPSAGVSYAGLRERLNKIMALDYFTTTPEMKAPVEMAAAGTYTTFQVPVQSVPTSVHVEVEDSIEQYQQKEADTSNYKKTETGHSQFSAAEELQKDESELENHPKDTAVQQGGKLLGGMDHNQRDVQPREQQYVPRRPYHNQRWGHGTGGGRRGFSNGRGGRGSGRGRGAYQNGRSQYYDQPGNNYYSRSYYNNRGRGSRSSGHAYSSHASADQGGSASADVGVAS